MAFTTRECEEYDAGWEARRDGEPFRLDKSQHWKDGWLKRGISGPHLPSYGRNDFRSDAEWETFQECLLKNDLELWKLFAWDWTKEKSEMFVVLDGVEYKL